MIITWQGHSCFKIQDKTGTDGITVVTDPFDKKIGLKVPNFEANIITISHDHYDHNNASALRGQPFIVKTAGEFDIQGVAIYGVESEHGGHKDIVNIMYRFEIDNISIAHLGDLGKALSDKQLEIMAGVDILLVPIGGKYTLDAKGAVEVVSQIEPRIVIPMHYSVPGLNIEIDGVDKFIREIGVKPTEEERLKISKKDLPADDMELVILKM